MATGSSHMDRRPELGNVRLSVHYREGRLERVDGEPMPKIYHEAVLTLSLHASAIADPEVREALYRERCWVVQLPSERVWCAMSLRNRGARAIAELAQRVDVKLLVRGRVAVSNGRDAHAWTVVPSTHEFDRLLRAQDADAEKRILDELLGPSTVAQALIPATLASTSVAMVGRGDDPRRLLGADAHVRELDLFATSLNHLLTAVSVRFEPGRHSHTHRAMQSIVVAIQDSSPITLGEWVEDPRNVREVPPESLPVR